MAQYEITKLCTIFQRCISISNILRDRNKETAASSIRAQLNGRQLKQDDSSHRLNATYLIRTLIITKFSKIVGHFDQGEENDLRAAQKRAQFM